MALAISEAGNSLTQVEAEPTAKELAVICEDVRSRYFSTNAPRIPNINGSIAPTSAATLAKICENARSNQADVAQVAIAETNNNLPSTPVHTTL